MSDAQREQVRTARQHYTCEEAGPRGCKRTAQIKPGDRYVYVSGIYEGEPYSLRFCLRCNRAWNRACQRFRIVHMDDGPAAGELTRYLWEERTGRPWEMRRHWLRRAAEARGRGAMESAAEFERMAADVRL